MKVDPVRSWLMSLGGSELIQWIKQPVCPMYLWGPAATGKTLFQRAWEIAKPNAQKVVTGNKASAPRGHRWIRVENPDKARELVSGMSIVKVVDWLREQ